MRFLRVDGQNRRRLFSVGVRYYAGSTQLFELSRLVKFWAKTAQIKAFYGHFVSGLIWGPKKGPIVLGFDGFTILRRACVLRG